MDIFNRLPAISEDTLQYALYPVSRVFDKADASTQATLIESLTQSLLPNHIWHRDSFEIKLAPSPSGIKDAWILEGRMRVGDSVDDEWCVVWLLREISARWDLAISVFDSDGEFLLIEAADVLPSWVTPTNAESRVWIYHSNLHLIPLSYTSPPSSKRTRRRLPATQESDDEGESAVEEGFITVVDALSVIADSALDCKVPEAVENAVWSRISGYPGFARQHTHLTKAWLPVDITKALSKDPSLVQRAIEAFYTRDALQLRAAQRMSRFPPQPSALVTLKMTRTAYAQLVGQKFHPPKIFGQFKERENTREWKWRDVGMKIACGFEMLYQESKARSEGLSAEAATAQSVARKDALRRNPEYTKYIQNLSNSGYFRGELQGSRTWNELEDKAAVTFISVRHADDASRPSFAALVNSAIASAGNSDSLHQAADEESDDWLNVDADSFDAKLTETFRSHQAGGGSLLDTMEVDKSEGGIDDNKLVDNQAEKLKGLAKKVEKFVEGKGAMEGAVFDDEALSDDEAMSEFSDDEGDSSSSESEDKLTRQEAREKLVAGLDPADYGKMPASFYANSQRVATTIETESIEGHTKPEATANLKTHEPQRSVRRPILPRDKFDGVDSDDETDDDDVPGGNPDDDESEEDRPTVVGDVEIDMAEEEDEFLEFAKEALGITEEQWGEIVRDRRGRGAFLPSSVYTGQASAKPPKSSSPGTNMQPKHTPREPQPGPRPNTNPNLDSFESVMQAMDEQLARARATKHLAQQTKRPRKVKFAPDVKPAALPDNKGKAKATAHDQANEEDVEGDMDAELRAALEREDGDSGDEETMDYNMIKNFLESFKSQSGLSGPVSNLAGRLQPGWTLPRDQS